MKKVIRWTLFALGGILLVLVVTSWNARHQFDRKVSAEIREFYHTTVSSHDTVAAREMAGLPLPVRKWLVRSGTVGHERVTSVRLKQRGEMRTKPDGTWLPFEARQYVRTENPGFIWKAAVHVAPMLELTARDRFDSGQGNMLIKFQSLFTVADSRGSEIDQASMVRYLAELAWYPPAALSSYLAWEGIDSTSARVTMTIGSAAVSGIFRFDAEGDLTGFEAQRYRESEGKSSLDLWSIAMRESRSFGGIRIPAFSEVTWKLPAGDYTWFRLELTTVEYNVAQEF